MEMTGVSWGKVSLGFQKKDTSACCLCLAFGDTEPLIILLRPIFTQNSSNIPPE